MIYRPLFLTFFVLVCLCFAVTGWAEKKSAKQIDALLKDEQKELSLLKKNTYDAIILFKYLFFYTDLK